MWKKININKEQIKDETANAMLIKMPNNSDYKGYYFWFPKKLIREGKHRNALTLSYTDDFVFKISKFTNGKVLRDELDVQMFESAFEVIDSNIVAPKDDESYLIVEEPKKIEKEIEIVEELKNESRR